MAVPKDMKRIREAICNNRGGLENSSDVQLLRLWVSFDKQTRDAYLESVTPERPSKASKTTTAGKDDNHDADSTDAK